MLVAFPENFRLYEHVKRTEKDGKTEVKSKTHAGAGTERQDAYLYGHPEGRKKRYRSPADFFPHLLWLCTDESGDPDNCGCKICSPDDLDEPNPVGRPRSKPEASVKAETGATVARPPGAQGLVKVKQEATAPGRTQNQTTASRPLVPSPLPPSKSAEQHYDTQFNNFLYRPGELVWFSRGAAWGLGTILRRWRAPQNAYSYTVQPLSHPFSHPPAVLKPSNAELRPWLAWSVPRYTYDALNNMPEPPKYDMADWQGMKDGRYGSGDLEVDGSILAAKAVDATYTLLDASHSTQVDANTSETYYDGLYLGAEKIWLGDPLRLVAGSGTDVIVLHSIVERKQTSGPNGQASQRSMQLWGDVYQLQTVTHTNINTPGLASSINNPQLPSRLTEDLALRNNYSVSRKHVASYWKLTATQARVELNEIKGRWYEASLLLPILQPAAYEDLARKGEIPEAALWMNARGDCINANRSASLARLPRQNISKSTRREAFGAALPAGAEIRDGIDPPLPANVDPALEGLASQTSMEIDPKFETADDANAEIVATSGPGEQDSIPASIDEFMDFGGADDSQSQMPGFGKEYGSQGGDPHGFF